MSYRRRSAWRTRFRGSPSGNASRLFVAITYKRGNLLGGRVGDLHSCEGRDDGVHQFQERGVGPEACRASPPPPAARNLRHNRLMDNHFHRNAAAEKRQLVSGGKSRMIPPPIFRNSRRELKDEPTNCAMLSWSAPWHYGTCRR
jgi:hypothetical protein